MKVCVTGGQGFIGSFICQELLNKGYEVHSVDDFSKYGKVSRPQDNHPNFRLHILDLSKNKLPTIDFDYIIAGAAKIGGIAYFSTYPALIMRDNELIAANTFDSALELHNNGKLRRIVVMSSSMVYEGADTEYEKNIENQFTHPTLGIWPTKESDLNYLPIPRSVYGHQKLSMEFWAKAYWQQYKMPYTIVRPFNGVGIGESESLIEHHVMSGNIKMQMSHILPDLINKCLKRQDPLRILGKGDQIRHYTNARDIARGIVMAMEADVGLNNDFNISTTRSTTVLELAQIVWNKINTDKPFRYECDTAFENDVLKRIPDCSKARDLLGFEAQIPLEDSVDEVIKWMKTNGN